MSAHDDDPELSFGSFLLSFTRVWLPVVIAALGVALIVAGHGSYSSLVNTDSIETACGVAVLIVALMVWMINWMYRLGVSSSDDREAEERAREHFDRTGSWPEDDAS